MSKNDDIVEGGKLKGRSIKGVFHRAHDNVQKAKPVQTQRAKDARRLELRPPAPFARGAAWVPAEKPEPEQKRVAGKKVRALLDRMLAVRNFNRASRGSDDGFDR